MKYRVLHRTRYEYEESVDRCANVAYVMPRDTFSQRCISSLVKTNPEVSWGNERIDYFGNRSFHFTIDDDHRVLEVTAESEVEVFEEDHIARLDFGISCADAVLASHRLEAQVAKGVAQISELPDHLAERLLSQEYTMESPLIQYSEQIAEYAKSSFTEDRPFLSAVREFTQRIHQDFKYDPEFTDLSTRLDEVFEHRRGVCQDFAHLAICALRSMGYAARYVSGYLETIPPEGQVKLAGSDASHAWFSVFSPGEGWFDFDPTNDLVVSQQHIVTAWGRDYSDVSPLRGVIFGGGGSHTLTVEVDVIRS